MMSRERSSFNRGLINAIAKSAWADVQAPSWWPPEDKFSDPRVAVRAHHQKIGVPIRHVSFKHVADAASFGIDFVEDHVDTVSRQVLGKLRTRPPGVDSLFFGHGENTDAFRFLQNRHRICDRSRGRPAEVPSDDHGVQRE
jgi:hypothetical protein